MIKDSFRTKIAVAQLNITTGDIKGNTIKILEAIRKAKADKADILMLPETAITGYCCGILFENEIYGTLYS